MPKKISSRPNENQERFEEFKDHVVQKTKIDLDSLHEEVEMGQEQWVAPIESGMVKGEALDYIDIKDRIKRLNNELKSKIQNVILSAKAKAWLNTDIDVIIDNERVFIESYWRLTEISRNGKNLVWAYWLGDLGSPQELVLLANLTNSLVNTYKWEKQWSWKFEFDAPGSIDFDTDSILRDSILNIWPRDFDPDVKVVSEKAIRQNFPILRKNQKAIEAFCDYLNKKI